MRRFGLPIVRAAEFRHGIRRCRQIQNVLGLNRALRLSRIESLTPRSLALKFILAQY
jgi:hypothetical protein